jgi:branched-chain amino acid transport system ATP-binding protein
MPFLDVRDLEVRYGKAVALERISIRVEANELVGVLGSNGAGKTTLLKAVSRVLASTGMLRFNGKNLVGMPAHKVVAEGICHCPEGRRLFRELTAEKNLRLGAYLRTDRDGIDADLERIFDLFPALRERRSQQAGTLSGGEQQGFVRKGCCGRVGAAI